MKSTRSKAKRNSKNHFEYKSLDKILNDISDPDELLEVQEFLSPADELPAEISSTRYFHRFAE